MALLAKWAKLPEDDYGLIMTPYEETGKAAGQFERARLVLENEFAAAKKVWDRLPQLQWETTAVIGRDLPEWADLREVLINFRKAVRKIRKLPKKVVNNAEGDSPSVPQ